jgi:hypothetical protein
MSWEMTTMDDFDNDLRQRLARLESSAPGPTNAPVAHPAPRRSGRRRQMVLLLAATAAVFALTTLVVVANQPPLDPALENANSADEIRLRDDLGEQIGDRCLDGVEARALIAARLDALGLGQWTIVGDDRISQAPCVGAAPAGDVQQVWLMPSMGGAVAHALDDAAPEFLRQCLNREEAEALLRSVLVSAGVSDPNIEVGGVQGVPLDTYDEYLAAIANGCVLLAGAQWDEVGRYTWYLASR